MAFAGDQTALNAEAARLPGQTPFTLLQTLQGASRRFSFHGAGIGSGPMTPLQSEALKLAISQNGKVRRGTSARFRSSLAMTVIALIWRSEWGHEGWPRARRTLSWW